MGKQLFEFTDAHREAAITCLTFDSSGRSYISFLYRLYLCKHYCWCLQQGMLLLSPVLGRLQKIEMDAWRRGVTTSDVVWVLWRGVKQSANLWKTGKHLKDVNESGLSFFFPCRRKVWWDLRPHLWGGEREQVRSSPILGELCPRARCIGWEFMLQVTALFWGKFLPWGIPEGLVRFVCLWKKPLLQLLGRKEQK